MEFNDKIKNRLKSVLASDKASVEINITHALVGDLENVLRSYFKLKRKPLVRLTVNEESEIVVSIEAHASEQMKIG